MATVLTIAPAPCADEKVRQSIIEVCETALAEANAGNISSIVVVALHPDGTWSDWQSATVELSKVVGTLEIAKQKRIKEIIDNQ